MQRGQGLEATIKPPNTDQIAGLNAESFDWIASAASMTTTASATVVEGDSYPEEARGPLEVVTAFLGPAILTHRAYPRARRTSAIGTDRSCWRSVSSSAVEGRPAVFSR